MNKQMRKVMSLILALSLLLTLMAGCNNAGESASSSTGTAGTTATASADTTDATGGYVELNIGYTAGWDSLTPFRANVGRNAVFAPLLYESLAIATVDKTFEPWVAKTWETNDNGFTYDIEIWDTVKDSAGNLITAADIVWFIEKSKELGLKPAFGKVESVEKTGDYTLQVKLTTNIVGTFETILTDTFVVAQTAFEASADEFGSSVVSTSPYLCTSFAAGSSMTFEKRNDYWQDEELLPERVRPNADKLNFQFIVEPSQMGIALETGVIDIAMDMAASTGAQFVGNNDYTVELTDGAQGYQMFFSGADTSPCANDKLLRQAICYAIDPEGLVTGLCAGFGTPMYDVCSPLLVGYNEVWKNEDYYGYDVEKAKDLLTQSGYNGEELVILAGPFGVLPRASEMIQGYLLNAGINCSIKSVDAALFSSIRLDGTQYDILLHSIGGTFLSDHWSIRYDPAAYSTGDATSRHDYDLAELLYMTWTPDGWTEANIDAVHDYLKDNAIAYGFVNPQTFTIWNNNVGLVKEVKEFAGFMAPAASEFTGE